MPEMPEVETVRCGLAPLLSDTHIVGVTLRRENLRFPFGADFAAKIKGKRTGALSRRGKYLLLPLLGGEDLLMHLGMSGRFRILTEPPATDQYEQHDHVVFETIRGVIVFNDARRFGFMELWPEALSCPRLEHLGPEPLSRQFSGKFLHQTLLHKSQAIKPALLDQSVCAGMGNIYASEALFGARIKPDRRANSLSAQESSSLALAVKAVLRRAISAGGTSLRDYVRPDGELGYFRNLLSVYGRSGQACPDCGTSIESLRQAGRAGFYCPACQQ